MTSTPLNHPVTARQFKILLPGLLMAVLAAPAGSATITSYQMTGTFDIGFLSSFDGSPVDNLYVDPEPINGATPFTLSFDLDDSAAGTSGGAGSSEYFSAISNLTLNVDGEDWWSGGTSDVNEFISNNGGADQNQWSFFADPYDATIDSSIEFLEVWDGDTGDFIDMMFLYSMDLYLVDTDATLFSANPPELVAFDGSEFEFLALELLWGTDLYEYTLAGEITAINVSAVPIPGAVWLFGSALLGLAGFARFKKQA